MTLSDFEYKLAHILASQTTTTPRKFFKIGKISFIRRRLERVIREYCGGTSFSGLTTDFSYLPYPGPVGLP